MGIFDKSKKIVKTSDDKAIEKKEDQKIEKRKAPVAPVKKGIVVPNKFSEIAYRKLMEPWITEKAHDKMAENKYIFKVVRSANKKNLKRAVEELYSVEVIKINISNMPPKKRKYGSGAGWKAGYKKAVITLKEGDKIELFEGV